MDASFVVVICFKINLGQDYPPRKGSCCIFWAEARNSEGGPGCQLAFFGCAGLPGVSRASSGALRTYRDKSVCLDSLFFPPSLGQRGPRAGRWLVTCFPLFSLSPAFREGPSWLGARGGRKGFPTLALPVLMRGWRERASSCPVAPWLAAFPS